MACMQLLMRNEPVSLANTTGRKGVVIWGSGNTSSFVMFWWVHLLFVGDGVTKD